MGSADCKGDSVAGGEGEGEGEATTVCDGEGDALPVPPPPRSIPLLGEPEEEGDADPLADGDALVAVGARQAAAHGGAHLASICTHPGSRGQGLGQAITASLAAEALQAGAPWVWLDMYADNAAAARTYGAVGFEEMGRYRSALRNGTSSPASEA